MNGRPHFLIIVNTDFMPRCYQYTPSSTKLDMLKLFVADKEDVAYEKRCGTVADEWLVRIYCHWRLDRSTPQQLLAQRSCTSSCGTTSSF